MHVQLPLPAQDRPQRTYRAANLGLGVNANSGGKCDAALDEAFEARRADLDTVIARSWRRCIRRLWWW